MLHLLRSYWRRLAKTPSVPLLWLGFPLLLAVIEYFAFGQVSGTEGVPKGTLLLVDHDHSIASGLLRSALQREPMSQFLELASTDDESRVSKAFEENQASAALVVPLGLQDSVLNGHPVEVVLTPNPRQTIRPQMIDAALQTFFEIANRGMHTADAAFQQMRAMPSGTLDRPRFLSVSAAFFDAGQNLGKLRRLRDLDIDVQRPQPTARGPAHKGDAGSFFTYFLPGLLLFSLLMIGQGFERRYFEDRLQGMARRISASPVPRRTLLLSEATTTFFGVLAGALVVLGVAVPLFKIHLRQPGVIGLVLVGFSLVVVGLTKALFARARSERAAATLASVVILMNTLIGGGFAPVEIFADNVRAIARATPVGAASQGLVDALVHGKGVAEAAPYILTTWAWGIGLCVLGFTLSRRSDARA